MEKSHLSVKTRIKRLVSATLAMAVAFTMVVSMPVRASQSVNYEVSISQPDDLVRVMKSYGFIAFGTLNTQGHQHMNAIAGELGSGSLGSEFNIRPTYKDSNTVTYIKHFSDLSGGMIKIGHVGDTLIVGEDYTVKYNSGEVFVNDCKVDNASNVRAETATNKYIDLEGLQQKFAAYSTQLAENKTNSAGVSMSGNKIDVTATSGAVYFNLNKESIDALNQDMQINFPADSTSVAVLNIDLKGTTWNRKPIELLIGGEAQSCGEEVYGTDVNRIYYNFYDSSAADGQYAGSVGMTEKGWGTIIAPKADVTVGSNFCGVIIANNLQANGESHRVNAYNPVMPKNGSSTTTTTTTEASSTTTTTEASSTTTTTETSTTEPKVTTTTAATTTTQAGTTTTAATTTTQAGTTTTAATTTTQAGTTTTAATTTTQAGTTTTAATTTTQAGTTTTAATTTTQAGTTTTAATTTTQAGTTTTAVTTTTESKVTTTQTATTTTAAATTTQAATVGTEEVGNDDVNSPNQPNKGTLVITITDEDTGEAVPDAVVEVQTPNNQVSVYTTDENGEITLTNVPVGTYTATVTKVPKGYKVTTGKVVNATVAANVVTKKAVEVGIKSSTSNKQDLKNAQKALKHAADVKTADDFDGKTPAAVMFLSAIGMIALIRIKKRYL